MNKLIKTAMAIFRNIPFGLSCTRLKSFSITHRSPLTCLRVFMARSKTTSLKQELLPLRGKETPLDGGMGPAHQGQLDYLPSSHMSRCVQLRRGKLRCEGFEIWQHCQECSSEAQMCKLLNHKAYLRHTDCHFLHSAVT